MAEWFGMGLAEADGLRALFGADDAQPGLRGRSYMGRLLASIAPRKRAGHAGRLLAAARVHEQDRKK
jgi:hypothetical protein